MKKTSYLILPIAAFALSATSAAAFNPEFLSRAGLTNSQVEAFVEAADLKKEGNKEAARNVLVEAGVDLDTIIEVRKAMHVEMKKQHDIIESAIENGDYEAFMDEIGDGPLSKTIGSEADFQLLVEAHSLRKAGDFKAAAEIFAELGLEPQHKHPKMKRAFVHGQFGEARGNYN